MDCTCGLAWYTGSYIATYAITCIQYCLLYIVHVGCDTMDICSSHHIKYVKPIATGRMLYRHTSSAISRRIAAIVCNFQSETIKQLLSQSAVQGDNYSNCKQMLPVMQYHLTITQISVQLGVYI